MSADPAEDTRSGRVLGIRQLSKTFPGTLALDHVDFDLEHGEIHALVGQNGSGKSTLIKVLAGYHHPDSGAVIELDGEEVEIHDTGGAREAGLRFVHQDLGLVASLNTIENLALGAGSRLASAGGSTGPPSGGLHRSASTPWVTASMSAAR